MIEITKDEFMAYERVRRSGVINMFAVSVVMKISELSKEKVLKIMENYSELAEKYLKKGEEK